MSAADAHDLGEDEVEDAEQEQRPHQRPDVAERRAEEAQLEVGDGEHPGEAPEAAQVVADGGRPAVARRGRAERSRALDLELGRQVGHAAGVAARPPRSARRCVLAAVEHARLRGPRRSTAGRQRVAAGGQPVLEARGAPSRARPRRTARAGRAETLVATKIVCRTSLRNVTVNIGLLDGLAGTRPRGRRGSARPARQVSDRARRPRPRTRRCRMRTSPAPATARLVRGGCRRS